MIACSVARGRAFAIVRATRALPGIRVERPLFFQSCLCLDGSFGQSAAQRDPKTFRTEFLLNFA